MLISNPKRKKQIAEFIDEDRAVTHEFYDITDSDISASRMLKEMHWGFLENRHLMRTIERYAVLCWENGKIDEALDIFRRLLRSNSNDNQGARYSILAIKMGLGVEEWQKPFEMKDKGRIVGLDAIEVDNWFEENAKKYSDEFDWLVKMHKEDRR